MQSLPTGTVTFLFSDVEGSTRLLRELGPEYDAVIGAHNEIIRAALKRRRGVEIGSEGDSFFAVFVSAVDAVLATADIQRDLAEREWPQPVRVRIGLHTGEGRLAGRDYIGLDINRASRIAAAGHGGQVLISEATKALVGDGSSAGVRVRGLGVHRLKDLPEPERLYQLVIDGVENEFPPPRSLEMTPSNLPQPLTAFFGRERELREARTLLESSRLLTLTGAGGSGKTRLSIELARDMLADFPDGVVFVPLAALREAELVVSAIAKAFGLSEEEALLQRLTQEIGSKELLLLLDNFEQLLPAASAVGEMLAGTPRLKILVTSRSPLGIYGEREYGVPPLSVPDPSRLPPLKELARSEAVALFVDRARSVRPAFALTAANAREVAEIGIRLDGLPLAIELAAARVKLLTPGAIMARLSDRLELLGSDRSSNGSDRQRTLRGTIQWSYELLSAEECALFSRMGVFLGGAPLSLIAKVLQTEDDVGLLDGLGSLIDKSLLRRSEDDGEVRVDMLETIREFALDRLEARGELNEYRERHALAFVAFAEDAAPRLLGEEGGHWLDRVDKERDNLRAAWTWAMEASRKDVALRLVAAAWRYWQMRGHLVEGRERADQTLRAATDEATGVLLARALEAAGGLAYWQADFGTARERYERWLELERRAGNRQGVAAALYNLCFAYFVPRDDPETARKLAEEALSIYRELGDTGGVAHTLWALGGIDASLPQPDDEASRGHYLEARDLFKQQGNLRMLAWANFMGAGNEARAGRFAAAREAAKESLRIFAELRDLSGYALGLKGMAVLEWVEGRKENAARLLGASDRLASTSGVQLSLFTSATWAEWGGDVETFQEDPQLTAAWQEGQAMEPEAAVAEALSTP